jgi:hypothetical protein
LLTAVEHVAMNLDAIRAPEAVPTNVLRMEAEHVAMKLDVIRVPKAVPTNV